MAELARRAGARPPIETGAHAEAVAPAGESCKAVTGVSAGDGAAARSRMRTARIVALGPMARGL